MTERDAFSGAQSRQRFLLSEEQRKRVSDCLRKTNIALPPDTFDRLVESLEGSIAIFLAPAAKPTFRSKQNALRDLWLLAREDDPRIGMIRARIEGLPNEVMDYIENRASHIVLRLEAQHAAVACAGCAPTDHVLWMGRGGFRAWARMAPDDLLCRAVAVLTAEGAQPVRGRSRGGGKRSAARLEPRILDVVRGTGEGKSKGGRPPADARQSLVMHLALDWAVCTERMPEAGRSDHTGFGDLVHSVFQWLELSPDQAEYALRAYWEEVESSRSRPVQ